MECVERSRLSPEMNSVQRQFCLRRAKETACGSAGYGRATCQGRQERLLVANAAVENTADEMSGSPERKDAKYNPFHTMPQRVRPAGELF